MLKRSFDQITRRIGYTLEEITTPTEDLLCWDQSDSTREDRIQSAEVHRITFLPVTQDGEIVGVISVQALKQGASFQSLTDDWFVDAEMPILELLERFANTPDRIYFVRRLSQIVGLVAPADLNRLAARASVYLLVASFEIELTETIRTRVGSDDEIVAKHLPPERLKKLDEERQKAKKGDLELGLIHYLYLDDLITIVQKHDELREALGFESRTQAKEALSFKAVRNPVSHLNSLLIESRQDMQKVNDTCHRLIHYGRILTTWNRSSRR